MSEGIVMGSEADNTGQSFAATLSPLPLALPTLRHDATSPAAALLLSSSIYVLIFCSSLLLFHLCSHLLLFSSFFLLSLLVWSHLSVLLPSPTMCPLTLAAIAMWYCCCHGANDLHRENELSSMSISASSSCWLRS